MGHVPADAKWYITEVVEEITVEGDPRNVVHMNFILIRADSPEAAYQKALKFGEQGETSYDNPHGHRVEIKFKGIADLDVIHDELEDGAELMFCRQVGLTEEELQQLIRPKEKLQVFQPPKRAKGPDCASKEVLEEVERRFEIKRRMNQ